MNHVIGALIIIGFVFCVLQFGFKVPIWQWIKKNIFRK